MSYRQRNLPAKSIEEAKRKGKKTFMGMDKSGMRTKKLAAVSREDMEKAGFKSFGKDSLNRYLMGKGPKKLTTTVTKTPVKTKKASSVGSGAATTITGKAKTKSATQINRELRKKVKGKNTKKKDDIKTGFFPKVIGKDIFSKKMRETADAAANNRVPNYMKKDNKKSTEKKPSILKRANTFLSKKRFKATDKQKERAEKLKETFGRKKIKKTTSSYNKKADPTAVSYKKGGGNVFVARQYGGKIGY